MADLDLDAIKACWSHDKEGSLATDTILALIAEVERLRAQVEAVIVADENVQQARPSRTKKLDERHRVGPQL